MMAEFIATEDSISDEEFQTFANDFELNLPASYRTHMVSNNGGAPNPDLFVTEEGEEYRVALFYSIKHGTNHLDRILKNLYDDEHGAPPLSTDYFPFAYDEGGNSYCIRLDGENNGHIYIVYHDSDDQEMITSSFDSFLAGLQTDPEYDL